MNRFVVSAVFAGLLLSVSQVAMAQPEPDKWYQIRNVNSKKMLALEDKAKKEKGALIVQRAAGPNHRQHWKFEKVGAFYKIINRQSGQALNVQNASGDEGTPLIQWDASDEGTNQQWTLEKKGDHYLIRARHSSMVVDVANESKERKAPVIQWKVHEGRNQLFDLVPVRK